MITVKATREGLVGGKTASGFLIDTIVPFVALPSTKAVGRFVRVSNPATGHSTLAVVLDIGPWNERDDAYVFQVATNAMTGAVEEIRPAAESGVDTRGRPTNGAGIDLGEAVWRRLGMLDNSQVSWEFVD